VFHATAGGGDDIAAKDRFDAQFETIKSIAALAGAANVYQRSASADTIAEAIVKESARDYDAVFAGASQAEGDYAFGTEK
jgi:hypothetical protein